MSPGKIIQKPPRQCRENIACAAGFREGGGSGKDTKTVPDAANRATRSRESPQRPCRAPRFYTGRCGARGNNREWRWRQGYEARGAAGCRAAALRKIRAQGWDAAFFRLAPFYNAVHQAVVLGNRYRMQLDSRLGVYFEIMAFVLCGAMVSHAGRAAGVYPPESRPSDARVSGSSGVSSARSLFSAEPRRRTRQA